MQFSCCRLCQRPKRIFRAANQTVEACWVNIGTTRSPQINREIVCFQDIIYRWFIDDYRWIDDFIQNKARFHNYVLTIPQPKPRDSTTKPRDSATKTGALPQLHSHDSTTKIPRFHNQSPTIPQPNSHDSTTKPPRFHNQNRTIPQPKSQDSTTKLWGFHNQKQPRFLRKTTATYFHYTRFLTSYKAFKNHPPPQNNRSNLSLQQAAPLLWEDYRYLLSLKKILDKLQDI